MKAWLMTILSIFVLAGCQVDRSSSETTALQGSDDSFSINGILNSVNPFATGSADTSTSQPPEEEQIRTLANMYQDDQCARKSIKKLLDEHIIPPNHQLEAHCFEGDLLIVGHTDSDIHESIRTSLSEMDIEVHDHTHLSDTSTTLLSAQSIEHYFKQADRPRPHHLKIVTHQNDVFLLGKMTADQQKFVLQTLSENIGKDSIINYIRITS